CPLFAVSAPSPAAPLLRARLFPPLRLHSFPTRRSSDLADFAAARSRGRLTRRDLAPGMTADDANRTLNDPEGGLTYAPTSPEALEDLREASKFTRGGSKVIERALAEAERSQDIADTRAGTRPIDKQREKQGRELRRRLGLDDGQGNMSIRDLIALQA